MRRVGGRVAAFAIAGALLLSACASDDGPTDVDDLLGAEEVDDDPTPEPTPDDETEEQDEAEVEDVDLAAYEPPDEIDEAYVLSVLDAMHEGFLPALRDAVAAGEVTPELEAALADIYVDDRVEHAVGGWDIRIAAELDGQPLRELDPQPEPRQHLAFYGLMLSDECVVGALEVDESPWYGGETSNVGERELVLLQAEPVPPVNPTPWRIAFDGVDGPGVDAC